MKDFINGLFLLPCAVLQSHKKKVQKSIKNKYAKPNEKEQKVISI